MEEAASRTDGPGGEVEETRTGFPASEGAGPQRCETRRLGAPKDEGERGQG